MNLDELGRLHNFDLGFAVFICVLYPCANQLCLNSFYVDHAGCCIRFDFRMAFLPLHLPRRPLGVALQFWDAV